jgi:hypothetical protein
MTDPGRSGLASRSGRHQPAAEAAADHRPLWMIALPSFACTVVLATYLLVMIGSRLI